MVTRHALDRDHNTLPWRDLARAMRQMEARGEIRGGHFVRGISGEQFALPEAIAVMRKVRRADPQELPDMIISASDPLNLCGILLPGPRVTSAPTNLLYLRYGLPVASREAGQIIARTDPPPLDAPMRTSLTRGAVVAG